MHLKFFLEDLLGGPVDLVTRRSIRPKIREQIERGTLCRGNILYLEDSNLLFK